MHPSTLPLDFLARSARSLANRRRATRVGALTLGFYPLLGGLAWARAPLTEAEISAPSQVRALATPTGDWVSESWLTRDDAHAFGPPIRLVASDYDRRAESRSQGLASHAASSEMSVSEPIRLAQLPPGDINVPAADPDPGQAPTLEVPIGPDVPPAREPSPPPAGEETPAPAPPMTPVPPGAGVLAPQTPLPPIVGNLAQAEGREISEVRVVGNRVVPAETILAQVRTQRGAVFSGRQLELDRARIDALGFFASVGAQITPDVSNPTRVVVTFVVTENRVVSAIRFDGNASVPDDALLGVLGSRIGVVLNRATVSSDVTAIQGLYRDRGFAVLVRAARQEDDGTLVFTIAEAQISRVEISGLSKTRPALIRRLIRTAPGQVFNATEVRRDLNRIFDTGFFEDVSFRIDDDEAAPGSVVVTLLLRERRTGQLSLGVGFDSRSRLSGFVNVSEQNFRGTGRRALVSLEAGSRRNFEVGLGDPFIGDKNASLDASIYTRTIIREPRLLQAIGDPTSFSFEEQRTGGRINFTRPLDFDRRRTLLFGYRNERARLLQRDRDGNTVPVTIGGVPLDDIGRVSAFSVGFLRDARDLRIDTSSGSRQSVVLEQALGFLGGDQTFTKLNLDLRQYVPLVRGATPSDRARLVLAGRLVLGRAINQLPAFEQYFIGGSDTVRGYETDEQFGDNQYFANLELRYRFQPRIQAVLFADAGTAFGGQFASSSGVNMLFSVGVGARLQTPIGPIRLDIGRGAEGTRTHFAIGPTF